MLLSPGQIPRHKNTTSQVVRYNLGNHAKVEKVR
jgi:hypothetical protein